MTNKQTVIAEVRDLLASGELSPEELREILSEKEPFRAPSITPETTRADGIEGRLSAIDSMFVVGGIILFIAIQVLIGQLSGVATSGWFGAIVCVTSAAIVWGVSWLRARRESNSEIIRGLTLAFTLIGSLLLGAAAYYLAGEVVRTTHGYSNEDGANQLYVFGLGMLVVTLLHVGFARVVRSPVVVGAAILAACSGLGSIMFGALRAANVTSLDVYILVFIGLGVLLYATTRSAARLAPGLARPAMFDGLAQFIALSAMTVGTYGELSLLWYLLVIGSVIGLLYLSVVQKSQSSLAMAAVFLIITLISMAFRYFSGMGVAFSLFLAALAVFGVAAAAVAIHKKYLS